MTARAFEAALWASLFLIMALAVVPAAQDAGLIPDRPPQAQGR